MAWQNAYGVIQTLLTSATFGRVCSVARTGLLNPGLKYPVSFWTNGRVEASSGPDFVAKITFTSCPTNLIPKFYPAEYFYAVSGSPTLNSVVYFEKYVFIEIRCFCNTSK
jgi:hypothetical protein